MDMNKERRASLANLVSELENIKSQIETLKDEEQEYFDNMPESFQSGDKGQVAEGTGQLAYYHVSNGRAYGPSHPGESLADYKARVRKAYGSLSGVSFGERTELHPAYFSHDRDMVDFDIPLRGVERAWMKEIERRFVMRADEDGGMREVGGWIVAALENREITIDDCYMALGK